MAKEPVKELRIAAVQTIGPVTLFGTTGLNSISETMVGIKLHEDAHGVRVTKEGQDGFVLLYAAGIACVRYRSEPRSAS